MTDYTALRYVPKGALKVADKQSDAVAYFYPSTSGKPAALVYYGKQRKPAANYRFPNEAARIEYVSQCFEGRRKTVASKAERAAERKSFQTTVKVGDIFNTCWGYEQTNREFFEVVAVKGNTVTLREIKQERKYTSDMAGYTVPMAGEYIGAPVTKKVLVGEQIKFDSYRYGFRWNTDNVAGIAMGKPLSFSEYA